MRRSYVDVKSFYKQCCGSGMFIPDPGSNFFPSRIRTVSIPDPGSSSKNLSILTRKKAKKWFLSSKKYDPGCSSRIRMLTFSHPGSRGQKSTQSRIRNTVYQRKCCTNSVVPLSLHQSLVTLSCSLNCTIFVPYGSQYMLVQCAIMQYVHSRSIQQSIHVRAIRSP